MTENLGAVLLLGLLSFLIFGIAWQKGFFFLNGAAWQVPLRWFHVVVGFAIYFGISQFSAQYLAKWILNNYFSTGTQDALTGAATWFNFVNSTLILFFLFAWLALAGLLKPIWQRKETASLREDFSCAGISWFVALPVVFFFSQVLEWTVTSVFHIPALPEQIAVHFLKMTFGHPLHFLLTASTIVIMAPLIEETLFRGLLQSYIRQQLGSKQAVGITSGLFAFFHFSPEQGLGNIPILGSLFAFALFLGFVYEKRASLLACIVLHGAFNLFSVINLFFLSNVSSKIVWFIGHWPI